MQNSRKWQSIYRKLKAIADTAAEAGESPRYQKLGSFNHVDAAAESSREGSEMDDGLPRYTSLKDVTAPSAPEPGGDIAIRNELVKRAASAYVLSAAVILPESRDQDSRIKICCLGFLSSPFLDFLSKIIRRIRAAFLN